MTMDAETLLLRAISFAARVHSGQTRKDGETPYIAHPMRVMTIMATVFGIREPEILATCVLHDTIEDTKTDRDEIIEHFGETVGGYVACLSKDRRLHEDERERAYLNALASAPVEVRLCKLADLLDNLSDSRGLDGDARTRTIVRAKKLVQRLAPEFPGEWIHVLECVRRAIDLMVRQAE